MKQKDKFLTFKLDIYQQEWVPEMQEIDYIEINYKIGMTDVFSIVEDLEIRLKLDFFVSLI